MGLIPTVSKKTEMQQAAAGSEEKRLMVNLESKIDELKLQNLENAKFLRGISRRLENELAQIKQLGEDREEGAFDDASILEAIEHIENCVKEINSDEVLHELDKIEKAVAQFDIGAVRTSIQELNNSIQSMDNKDIMEELDKMNNALLGFNADVIFLEIDKVNKALKRMNSDAILQEISLVYDSVSRINTEDVMKEINRLEALVSEINSNAVLAELGRLRQFIAEKDSGAEFKELGKKLDKISQQNNADELEDIKNMLIQNAQHIDNIETKLERISTMPVTVKSIIQSENENILRRIDGYLVDLTQQQDSKMSNLKSLIGFNLWLSLLAVVLIIVNILGII